MKMIVLFIVLTSITSVIKSEVIISGRITNTNEQFLYYSSPLDNFCGIDLNNKVKLFYINKTAKFTISIKLNSPVFIKLQIALTPIWLLIEPNDSLVVELDFKKYKDDISGLKIQGNNKEGNLLYNENNRNPLQNFLDVFNLFDKEYISKDSLLNDIKTICKSKTNPYCKLYDKQLVSKKYLSTMCSIIRSHQLKEVLLKLSEKNTATNNIATYDKKSIIDGIKVIQDPLDTMLNNGFYSDLYQYFSFTNEYLQLKKLATSEEIKDSIIFIDNKQVIISKFFVPLLFVNNKIIQQNIWAKILYQTLQLFKDKVYETDFIVFKYQFPNSDYNSIFQKIESKNIKSTTLFKNGNITVLDTTGEIKSLSDIVKYNLGKIIYVDLWASWCLPCRQEFIEAKKVEKKIKENNIVKLYISFDEEYAKKNWIDLVYKYKLTGYHILASRDLKKEILKKIFKSRNDYSIPRYFITTNFGKILIPNAYRPSDGSKLIYQLRRISK